MTSSFFINREKTWDLKLEDILPQSQLPSNKKIDILAKAVHNIILNNGNDYDLTPDQKKLLQKTNNEINASYFKKKLEDRFLEYTSPEYSSSTLKEANLVYRQQRRREVEIIMRQGKEMHLIKHSLPSKSTIKMKPIWETFQRKTPSWAL